MRNYLLNSMVTTRWPEDAGGELATIGGGEEATVLAKKELRASRSFGKGLHGFA